MVFDLCIFVVFGYNSAQPKGVRLGYMGHLTYIADETVKLLELYSQTSLLPMLYEFIDLDDWWSYVSKTLKETKERDAQVLGGSRPNMMDGLKSGLDDGNDDDFMDDNEGEYGGGNGFLGQEGGGGHDGDVGSDQVKKASFFFLCRLFDNIGKNVDRRSRNLPHLSSTCSSHATCRNRFRTTCPTNLDHRTRTRTMRRATGSANMALITTSSAAGPLPLMLLTVGWAHRPLTQKIPLAVATPWILAVTTKTMLTRKLGTLQ